ncbi:hypothetical protein LTS10_003607 [Elasticomyces elasticus]|nr:hypothetical protein LTS10_003607 [Elasticomyces elasticus]
MPRPGYIVHPDGSKKFVQDKAAYHKQYPETIDSTLAAHEQHREQRQRIEAELNEQIVKEKERRLRREMDSVVGGHWCVGGRAPRNCDACKSSFLIPGGPESTDLPCMTCRATKTLWVDCDVCQQLKLEQNTEEKAADAGSVETGNDPVLRS